MALSIQEAGGGCEFLVRVVPRGRRDQVIGPHGDAIKIRLAAPPVDGKANHALQVFLAQRLGVTPSAVEIVWGHSSRLKRVRVAGVTRAAVLSLLEG